MDNGEIEKKMINCCTGNKEELLLEKSPWFSEALNY
jgi:hypothetical protein